MDRDNGFHARIVRPWTKAEGKNNTKYKIPSCRSYGPIPPTHTAEGIIQAQQSNGDRCGSCGGVKTRKVTIVGEVGYVFEVLL